MSHRKAKEKVWENDIVFFDTELTGLGIEHEIIEIGFIKAKAQTFAIMEEKVIKLHPVRLESGDPAALKIAGYDKELWEKEAVDQVTGLAEFLSYTDGVVLGAHNLPMDWMHLHRSLKEHNLEPNFYYKGLDTFSFAWNKLFGNDKFKKFSLEELSEYFEIDPGSAHRALDDARTAFKVFIKLING